MYTAESNLKIIIVNFSASLGMNLSEAEIFLFPASTQDGGCDDYL
jgi:hypothetical protein